MATTAEIQNWIQNSGYGSFDPNGGFSLTGSDSGNAPMAILGAAQAAGVSPDQLSTAVRGVYSPNQISSFQASHQPQTDIYASVYNTDKANAGGGNLGLDGVASLTSGGGGSSGGGSNPYLGGMASEIQRRSDQSLGRGLNGIRSQYSGVGGLGGSRQGVAEGLAIQGSQDSLQGNLTNLYGSDWTNQQNRNLQQQGLDNSYNLGMGNLALGNRNTDLSAVNTGFNLFNGGNTGYLSQGQGVYGVGNTQQQAPWQVINNASGAYSPYTGYGATNTGTSTAGGGAMGVAGGALAGNVLGRNLGFGGATTTGYEPWQTTGNGMPSWYTGG